MVAGSGPGGYLIRNEHLRQRHVARLRLRIERDSYPRLQMFFLVSLTGAAGLLASFSLMTACFAAAADWALEAWAPGANSIGKVLMAVKQAG